MSTRSGRIRASAVESSPPRTRPSRSPARARKYSPSRKSPPARQAAAKSPSRKSPSRKPASKFPARKSPARITKESVEKESSAPKSPAKRQAIKTNAYVKLNDLSAKLESYRTRSKRIEYSINDVVSSTQSEFTIEKLNGIEPIELIGLRNRRSVEEITPRRSSRLREFMDNVPDLPDIGRSVSKSLSKSASKSISRSIDTYSEGEHSSDEFKKEKSKSVTRKLSTPLRNSISNISQIASKWEFGGRVGTAALVLLIPLTVLTILTACMKSCSIDTVLNFSPFKSTVYWFSWRASCFIGAQILIQAIFTVFPLLGPKADRMDGTGTKQCFNGPFSVFFTIHLLVALEILGYTQMNTLLRDYLKLATASYIFAVLLSIILFVKSRKLESDTLNPHGNTGYVLYDFFIGREIHPFFKRLDVKLWVSRISNITSIVLSLIIFTQAIKLPTELTYSSPMQEYEKTKLNFENYKELMSKLQYQPTIIVFASMQILYITGFIAKEYRIASTFYWQSEGLGYMQIVSSALYPYYFTSLSKYVVDVNLSLSTNMLIAASTLFLIGFSIMLLSNNIKYEFRRDPLQPGLANLESMPTFHGKKLLISNLWGILRHPNYTGDIIVHLALALPGLITREIVAASPALITILVLLHRAWRDDARCKRRYGAAWIRYCKKVPSVIIPKVL